MSYKRLWYDSPAREFTEALPVGNGRVGGMVYGGAKIEKISLNEDTLWSGYPKDKSIPNAYEGIAEAKELLKNGEIRACEETLWKKCLSNWTEAYQPAGNLIIECEEIDGETEYYRELNISDAVSFTKFSSGGYAYTREVIASNPANIIAIRQTSEKSDSAVTVKFECPHIHKYIDNGESLVITGLSPYLSQPSYFGCDEPIKYDSFEDNRALTYSMAVRPVLANGTYRIADDKIEITSSDFTLYVDIETNFEGYDKHPRDSKTDTVKNCLDKLTKALNIGYETIRAEHIADYRSLFDRCEIKLCGEDKDCVPTDQRLIEYVNDKSDNGLAVLLFDYGRYLTISASRENTQPMNLQGIWNEELRAPWSSNYTININAQMNYWHVEAANLSECHIPFIKMIAELAKNGEKTAKNNYHCRGWCSHHNTDIWRQSEAVGGEADNCSSVGYGFWNMSSGWLARHIFEHYEYTNDKEFLRKYWDVIKGAALFMLDWLEKGDDGKLITPIATSPENRYSKDGKTYVVSKGSAMDLGIIRDVFGAFIKGSEALGCDPELTEEIGNALENLKPFGIDSKGQIIEFDCEYEYPEVHHRHLSHLYGLYPGESMNTPELKKAAEISMNIRGEDATGWGLGWKINVWARLGNGDKAKLFIDKILRPVTNRGFEYAGGGGMYPNLFDAHPPFQIDGNFGAAAGILEMLVQNRNGEVVLLPALPKEWHSGSARGIRVKGGKNVSFSWENGKVTSYTEE